MALTLASGISASDRYCTVNQPPTQPPGSYYRIGDEVVQHIGFATPTPIWSQTFLQLYVARGQLGTTAASHLSGAALTFVRSEFLSAPADSDPGPFETGGGGLETPVTEAFTVAPITDPAPAASLTIQEVAGQGADLVLVKNATDGVIFSINSSSGVQWGDPGSNTRLTFRPDGELQAKDASGNTYLAYSPGALLLALGAQQGISIKNDADSGYDFIGIAANAAPPDAFVFRGSLWFWFDDTEGAAKLMVKGKDSGDNIVTGSINLT
jgi:hypothetical protein